MKLENRFPLLVACFVLSGFAGLIYETVWTQQFALVFGTSELALATVLAAYMAGLALGASVAGRWASRVRRPILLYAVLELGIGIAALAVPAMIGVASRLQVALLGGVELPRASAGSALFYLASSFLILLVPTTLMGATLPLLARQAVRREQEIGRRIGVLYAANTAGAAAGTLAAAFLLLPRIGLGPTVWVAAAINVLVFALAALLARVAPEAGDQHRPATGSEAAAPPCSASAGAWILPLVLVSGAVSLTWEILWTRLLGHLLGGSVYAFATMLATFLVGLALGSAAASRLASDAERARRGFAAAQIAIAGLSLAAFAAADRLPALARKLTELGIPGSSGVALCAATLLPGAIAIGATFPLAVRVLARDASGAARASARVFTWNTAGAIAGSLGAGYLLLPALKFAATAAVATAVSLALALAAALVRPRRRILAAAALAGLLVVATVRPGTPWQVLRRGALGLANVTPGEVVHYGVGRSATVLLHEQRAGWRLTTNGLPESFIGASWQRPAGQGVAHWLTLLPFAARPETRSLLVIGLGGGVTAEDVPRAAEEIHVVELEPEVVRANRLVAGRRRVDPLADPRLRLHVNDARGALRLTSRRFDAVVSQPSHPWTSGASHLFTREFLESVRERLTEGGVFVQWMGLPFVDEVLLRSLVATAAEVFPHVELYRTQGAFLVLASAAPLDVAATAGRALDDEPRLWARLGVLCPEDVLATRMIDSAGARHFAAEGRPSTDFLNLFRTRSPKILGKPLKAAEVDRILEAYDPLLETGSEVDRLYLVRSLIRRGEAGRARRLAETLPDPVARQTAVGLVKLATDASAGELELRDALSLAAGDSDPRASEALHALLIARYRPAIRRGEQVSFTSRFLADPAAAVIAGWRAAGAGDWHQLRGLEQRLVAVEPRHPLFSETTRLRARWRVEGAQPEIAAEAMTLLETVLSPVGKPADVLLYARAATHAGKPLAALAAIGGVLPRLERGSAPAREAAEILRSLDVALAPLRGDPAGDGVEEWRRELSERLRRPPGAIMTQDRPL